MKPAAHPPAGIDAVAARWIARRDAGLSAAAAAELARWRDADPRHAAALARFEAAWSALARPRAAGRAAALAREIDAARRRRRGARLAAAAAAAALVAGSFFLWPRLRERAAPGPAATATVVRPERRVLPDGSAVDLKPGAIIAEDFGGALRRVRLVQGEALFEVAKDPARAFVVEAGGVAVRAVGTAFAVQLAAAGVEVLVTEGRVAVARPAEPPIALVAAGSRVTIAAGRATAPQVAAVPPAELAERLAWRAPRAEFSGAPLGEVVALLNRHQRTQLTLGDAALARVPVSGLFRLDDTAALLGMLEAGFGLAAEPRGENEIVLRARQ